MGDMVMAEEEEKYGGEIGYKEGSRDAPKESIFNPIILRIFQPDNSYSSSYRS